MKRITDNSYDPQSLSEINRKKLEARHRGSTIEVSKGSNLHSENRGRSDVLQERNSASANRQSSPLGEMFMGLLLNDPPSLNDSTLSSTLTHSLEKSHAYVGTNSDFSSLKLQEQSNQQTLEEAQCTQFEFDNAYLGKVVLKVTNRSGVLSVNIQAKHALDVQQAHTLVQLVRAGLKNALGMEHLEVRID